MTVQTYIMKKDYASLHQVLGHVLPEITEDTYYEKNLVKNEFINKDKFTMKDMRNVITWQLWIEHLISYFPSFSTIHAKDMTKKQQWKRLGNALYSNHQQIPFLEGKDLGIYDYDKDKKSADEDIKRFKEIATHEERHKWLYKRMFEIAASKKMDILASQDIIGKSNKRQIMVTHEVAHILQYMTYVSTTENELTSTMTQLREINEKDAENFITTIKNINYCGIHLGNLHCLKMNSIIRKHMSKDSEFKDQQVELFKVKKKDVNAKRNDFILKKQYYEKVMEFIQKYGLHPTWNTSCMKSNNPILFNVLTKCCGNDDTYKQDQTDMIKCLQNATKKKKVKVQNKLETNLSTATDVILNFIAWYINYNMEQIDINENSNAKTFFEKHNNFWQNMIDQKNVNVKQRKAYEVDDWDIMKIADKLLSHNENDTIKIDGFLDLEVVNNEIKEVKNEKKMMMMKKKKKKKKNLVVHHK